MNNFSPFEKLGVTTSATSKQISTAFKKLSLRFHPDKSVSIRDEKVKKEWTRMEITQSERLLQIPAARVIFETCNGEWEQAWTQAVAVIKDEDDHQWGEDENIKHDRWKKQAEEDTKQTRLEAEKMEKLKEAAERKRKEREQNETEEKKRQAMEENVRKQQEKQDRRKMDGKQRKEKKNQRENEEIEAGENRAERTERELELKSRLDKELGEKEEALAKAEKFSLQIEQLKEQMQKEAKKRKREQKARTKLEEKVTELKEELAREKKERKSERRELDAKLKQRKKTKFTIESKEDVGSDQRKQEAEKRKTSERGRKNVAANGEENEMDEKVKVDSQEHKRKKGEGFACVCGLEYAQSSGLSRHLRQPANPTLKCNTCNQSFTRLDNLNRHVKQEHK